MKLLSFKKTLKQHKGFTLIEVMVSISIFTVVMVVALGAILSIVNANRKAQSLHTVINNVNLAVETMTRDLRTGYGYKCGGIDCVAGVATDEISFASRQMPQLWFPTSVLLMVVEDIWKNKLKLRAGYVLLTTLLILSLYLLEFGEYRLCRLQLETQISQKLF